MYFGKSALYNVCVHISIVLCDYQHYMHICMPVYQPCVWMFVCQHCMHVHAYMYVCSYIRIKAVFLSIHVHTYVCTYVCTYLHAYVFERIEL